MTRPSGSLVYLVFTDLDGTLLDHHTYEWAEAAPALDFCRRHAIPVILASSKTRAELDLLRRELSLPDPFISENGGGIYIPMEAESSPPPEAVPDGDLYKWPLGVPYGEVVKALGEIREELGWRIRGFSDMDPGEICERTGLEPERARLAAAREYDEPFVVLERSAVDRDALTKAAARRGLRVTEGGRFFHLQSRADKGEAVGRLISWYGQSYPRVVSVVLGDSPNDFSMLERADFPVLVRSHRDYPHMKARIPALTLTGERGPKGWNRAVLDIMAAKEDVGDD